jgi:integrase/recombinase XerC
MSDDLPHIFAFYVERLHRKRVNAHTLDLNLRSMRKLNDWCQVERIDPQAITLTDLERFFDHLLDRYAVSTTRLTATTIKAVYRYAHGRGLIPVNPCLDLILPIEPDTEPRVFTSDELRAILAAVRDPRENLIIHLLAYAGLRRQECREARRDDVDLQRATMRVLGKGKKWRVIPIHPCLADAIDLMERVRFDPFGGSPYVVPNLLYPDQPISHSHWSHVLDPILKRARVKGTAHTFRKTLTSSLVANGANTSAIDRIMGWSARTVRSRYYTNVADDLLRKTILLAYADDPISPAPRKNQHGGRAA